MAIRLRNNVLYDIRKGTAMKDCVTLDILECAEIADAVQARMIAMEMVNDKNSDYSLEAVWPQAQAILAALHAKTSVASALDEILESIGFDRPDDGEAQDNLYGHQVIARRLEDSVAEVDFVTTCHLQGDVFYDVYADGSGHFFRSTGRLDSFGNYEEFQQLCNDLSWDF